MADGWKVSEQDPIRIPTEVLKELESVRRYTAPKYWTYRPCDTWRWRWRSPRWWCGSMSTSKSMAKVFSTAFWQRIRLA